MASLKGEQGQQGIQGIQGEKGDTGAKGDKGDKGDQGIKGDTGTGVSKVEIIEDKLVITLSDETVINLGNVKGAKGDKGDKGDTGADGNDGVGISAVVIDTDGHLKITLTTGITTDLGNVKGADGQDGVGIDEIYIQDGNLYVKKTTDTTAVNLGSVKGEKGDKGDKGDTGEQGPKGDKGDKGDAGRGIVKTEIIDGHLWITYTNDLDNPVDVGEITTTTTEGTDGLAFYPLDDGTYGVKADPSFPDIEVAEIPATYKGVAVTQILDSAFEDCESLTRVIIPDTVTYIGSNAFLNCTNLTKAYYEGNLTGWLQVKINNGYGSPCYYKARFYVGETLSEISNIQIPSGITTINAFSFYGCQSLTGVEFAKEGVTDIGKTAFANCSNLSSVNLPDTLTKISSYAFRSCTSLTEITIPSAVNFIGQYAFYKSGLKSATFENTENWSHDEITFSRYVNTIHEINYTINAFELRQVGSSTRYNDWHLYNFNPYTVARRLCDVVTIKYSIASSSYEEEDISFYKYDWYVVS